MLRLEMEVKKIPQSVFIEKEEISIIDCHVLITYGGFSNVHAGSYCSN